MMTKGNGSAIEGVRYVGPLLGIAGSLLDFYSGYQLLGQGGMAGPSRAWGIGILLLGSALALTTIAVYPRTKSRHMSDFGFLMVAYGAVMLFIGFMMYSGEVSMMQGGVASGLGMILVGALMLANGGWMMRSQSMGTLPPNSISEEPAMGP